MEEQDKEEATYEMNADVISPKSEIKNYLALYSQENFSGNYTQSYDN